MLAVAIAALAISIVVALGGPPQESAKAVAQDKTYEWIREAVFSATFWAALFTAALTFSTVGLWLQTKRLAEGAEDQSAKMLESIRHQRRTAYANLISARATRKTADAAEKQAVAAVGAELPILHIIKMSTPGDNLADREEWLRRLIPEVKIKNFGRTTAVVTDLIINLETGLVPPEPTPLVKLNKYPEAVPIEPQQTHEFSDYWVRNQITDQTVQTWLADEKRNLHLYGRIFYRDFTGAHEQGFLFIWVEESRMFASFEQMTQYYTHA